MALSEPAPRTTYRTRPRPRPKGLRAIVAVAVLVAAIAAGLHLLAGGSDPLGGGSRPLLAVGEWPAQGQAAIVVGAGAPAASPGQRPAPIASLAKVMTAYLTLKSDPIAAGEEGFALIVTPRQAEAVAAEADGGQSTVPIVAGERLSERRLLEALLIPSGNNVARMLATRIAGGEAAFVAEMNAAAGELGMDATTYTDPSGFDPGTVSTAADQLRVLRAAMRFGAFRQIASTGSVTLPVAGTLTNFNPLIGAGYGGKTGSDSAAGGCLAFFTRVTVGGHSRIVAGVVMGQGTGSDTAALLEAAGSAAEGLVASVSGRSGSPHIRTPRRSLPLRPPGPRIRN